VGIVGRFSERKHTLLRIVQCRSKFIRFFFRYLKEGVTRIAKGKIYSFFPESRFGDMNKLSYIDKYPSISNSS